ncbi:MAG TPA: type II toxin-antitoxin system Phd/YefM family antitoxin [Candidatus Absconditabacterales bacterium]|nr:type II toxin-antitoxin system Phd/YefM family antitoxin [Candidatus Absconditabacterales bacterium]HMT26795.1 type II toxin-antitoxin system Phd/YefM family antitoxin [Candidatus Absconditabacterales bacterium]
MLTTSSIIGISELRTQTTSVLKKLKKQGSLIAVSNNKPIFVVVSPEKWDEISDETVEFAPLPKSEITKEMLEKIAKTKQKNKKDFTNL